MLKNYLKITWAVMKRRKFYTFISLFGITLTMTILIVLTSFIDQILAPNYPESDRSRTLYVQRMTLEDRKNKSTSSNSVSAFFIKTYVRTMPRPEKVGLTTMPDPVSTYVNGRKAKLWLKYTDDVYWQMTHFDFVEGKQFTPETIANGDKSVIITESICEEYFGKNVSALGKELEIGEETFRIVGVVKGSPITQIFTGSDIYLPYTVDKYRETSGDLGGKYMAMVLAKTASDVPLIQKEFLDVLSKIPLGTDKDIAQKGLGSFSSSGDGFEPDTVIAHALTYAETFTTNLTLASSSSQANVQFFTVIIIFALLFMLLPALNLVNINISRIIERASEIAIRKAFGASAATLTTQFIIENIILTLAGGLIAIAISLIIIVFLNKNGIGPLPFLSLSINWLVVAITMFLCFIFGLMSGAYPAWRMAKLTVVDALKN